MMPRNRAAGEPRRLPIAGVRTVIGIREGMPPPRLASPLTYRPPQICGGVAAIPDDLPTRKVHMRLKGKKTAPVMYVIFQPAADDFLGKVEETDDVILY